MAAPDLVNLSGLIDDAKCFALVCQQSWLEGVQCPQLRQTCGDPGAPSTWLLSTLRDAADLG
jgi:hypothetical protein